MQAVTTIGLDIAKSVFQIHGVDAAGNNSFFEQGQARSVTGSSIGGEFTSLGFRQ
jgi:hypothetical protein